MQSLRRVHSSQFDKRKGLNLFHELRLIKHIYKNQSRNQTPNSQFSNSHNLKNYSMNFQLRQLNKHMVCKKFTFLDILRFAVLTQQVSQFCRRVPIQPLGSGTGLWKLFLRSPQILLVKTHFFKWPSLLHSLHRHWASFPTFLSSSPPQISSSTETLTPNFA